MLKKINWSSKAKRDRSNILAYWIERNKSELYSAKLNQLFSKAVFNLAKYNLPRRVTEFKDVYVVLVKEYKIFFRENEDAIFILRIWDVRQDPSRLNF